MKKIILLTLIPCCFIFSQMSFNFKEIDKIKYNCRYKMIFRPDSTNRNYVLTENLTLLIGEKGISCFLSTSSMDLDSIFKNINPSANNARGSFISMIGKFTQNEIPYRIFKNYPENNSLIVTNMSFSGAVKNKESMDLFDWQLEEEEKVIEGYTCQKATTNFRGREFTAWFSSEIPISEGPYKFNGLPGLIMEISDSKEDYRFLILDFKNIENQNKQIQILNEEKMVPVSNSEYLEWEQNSKKMMQMNSQNGGRRGPSNADNPRRRGGMSEEGRKMLEEYSSKESKKNNPLELIVK